MKKCGRCKIEKPLSDFSKLKNPRSPGETYPYYCRKCKSIVVGEWAKKNPEKMQKWGRKWRVERLV